MGQEQLCSAVVLGGFGQVGLLVGELYRVNIVGLGEEHPGRGNFFELCPVVLVHLLSFVGFCRELRAIV